MLASAMGASGFLLMPFAASNHVLLMSVFFLVGGFLGSFYSLGLAFLGDSLLPGDITTGNVLYTMIYGIGSLIGPSLTGLLISWMGENAFAWSIAVMLAGYVAFGMLDGRSVKQQVTPFTHKGS
jgi:MFS family permease